MKKISLQWRLTILTTVLITVLCGCLTFFLYKNGIYHFDTLQETVMDQSAVPEAVYIDIPDNEWDDLQRSLLRRFIIRKQIIETEVF